MPFLYPDRGTPFRGYWGGLARWGPGMVMFVTLTPKRMGSFGHEIWVNLVGLTAGALGV